MKDKFTVLGIDTSATSASVSVVQGDRLISSLCVNMGNCHSQTLLPMIREALRIPRLSVSDVDLVACTVGPGSFTGVRIGVSTAKGICDARSIPCVGVSSLCAAAYNLSGVDGICVPAFDARRGNVYAAIFDGKDFSRLSEDMIISAEELSDRLISMSRRVYAVGDGAELLREKLTEKGGICAVLSPLVQSNQASAGAAFIARDKYLSTEDKSIFTSAKLAPLYLRPDRANKDEF